MVEGRGYKEEGGRDQKRGKEGKEGKGRKGG